MSSKSLEEIVAEIKKKIASDNETSIKMQCAQPYTDEIRDEAIAFHEKREEARRCARIQARREAATAAGVPSRILDLMSDLQDREAVRVVRDFMAGNATLLVLAGSVGTGKSVAVGDACGGFSNRGLFNDKAEARFLKAIDLLRIGIYGDEAERFAEDCKHKKLIVIDDLGTEPRDEKGYAAANFEAAMDYRYDAELKTILTTNLDFDAFKKRYCDGGGTRFMDRLREVGVFHGLAGKSLREKRT